jgi:hemoglobin/transferrin/lactoferrin receptor protein
MDLATPSKETSAIAQLLAVLLPAGLSAAASAQTTAEPAGAPPPPTLPETTISATRERRSVDETSATVTVLPAETIERRFVKDIRDLVRNEPGVVVQRAPARFSAAFGSTGRDGNAGFNIRGLDGNRVLIQVDGIRVPAAFSFGAASFGRGGYADISSIRAVEILRGPASSLYGSDGLAGVVSFYSFDPLDLLGEQSTHLGAAAAYAGEDRSRSASLRAALRLTGDASAGSELLAIVTHRQGEALRNFGSIETADARRTAPNPLDSDSLALLTKWVHRPSADTQWRVTIDTQRTDVSADVLSARSIAPLTATGVLRLLADDRSERTRVSIDLAAEALAMPLADRVQAAVYWQDAEATQVSREDRNTAADRTRSNRYGERLIGINAQFDLAGQTGALAHRLIYGLDLSRALITNLRDGTVPPAGETFPTKAFADSDYDTVGVFVHDEITLRDGLFVTPALRYDHFALDPRRDAQFPGTPVSLSDGRLTPKLALRWQVDSSLALYAHLAQGFRAPTPAQVNNGFTNLTAPGAAYRSIGNPALKPERSTTLELGARGSLAAWRWTAAVFDGRYRDFIEQSQVGGTGAASDPLLFQFVNLRAVRIRGFEARTSWQPRRDWRFEAAYARAQGELDDPRRPLNSVQPPKASISAAWSPGTTLSIEAFVNHVRAKARARIDSSGLPAGAQQFAAPLFTTLDVTASWQLARQAELGLGVFNLTDRKHWHWSDVQGVAQSSPLLDAFTQPGRSFAARLRVWL